MGWGLHDADEVKRDFNLPILIHISMKKHEDWQPRFARVLKDFPDVTFIAAHYGKFAPEVEKFQRFLDEFSNLYFDVSMVVESNDTPNKLPWNLIDSEILLLKTKTGSCGVQTLYSAVIKPRIFCIKE